MWEGEVGEEGKDRVKEKEEEGGKKEVGVCNQQYFARFSVCPKFVSKEYPQGECVLFGNDESNNKKYINIFFCCNKNIIRLQ